MNPHDRQETMEQTLIRLKASIEQDLERAVELAKDIVPKTVLTHHVTQPEIELSKALLALKEENGRLEAAVSEARRTLIDNTECCCDVGDFVCFKCKWLAQYGTKP